MLKFLTAVVKCSADVVYGIEWSSVQDVHVTLKLCCH